MDGATAPGFAQGPYREVEPPLRLSVIRRGQGGAAEPPGGLRRSEVPRSEAPPASCQAAKPPLRLETAVKPWSWKKAVAPRLE